MARLAATLHVYDERYTMRLMERVSESVWGVIRVPLVDTGHGTLTTVPVPVGMTVHRIEVCDPEGRALWWQDVTASPGDTLRISVTISGAPPA